MNRSKMRNILSAVCIVLIIFLICRNYFGQAQQQGEEPSHNETATVTQAASSTGETDSDDGAEPSRSPSEDESGASYVSPEDDAGAEDSVSISEYVQYRFRNKKLLEQHYEKHGIEMGFDSKEAYEQAAGDVINNPEALFKHEAEDGDGVYYIEATNEFVILSTDGYIRTYFLPEGKKAYFDRQ